MQTYVEAMQPGWNLGNTLDATPTETSWGNPLVTEQFIQQIAAQGFKSIRIPVTWRDHLGPAPSHTIDPVWLNRVQQIVDWSLDAGLYVMLNMHHDSYWVREMPADHDGVFARYTAVWSQIVPRFRDHPRELMLESINEPEFDAVDDATKMALLHELNTAFFNIVRGNGGGNATRPLVLPTVVTNASQPFLDSLNATITQLNDPNLIATIHYYGYWPFSVNIAGQTRFDGNAVTDITATLDGAYNTFVSQGVPVVIGEFGVLAWDSNNQAIERGELLKFFEYFTSYARSKGVTCQLWDNGQHFNRATYQWRDPEFYGYIMHGLTAGRSSTAATDLIFLKKGAAVQDVVIPVDLHGNSFVSLQNGATTLTPGTDYTFDGSALRVKTGLLVPYSSGALGEKTVLTANFSAGMPWKLRVRHHDTPVLGAASGARADGLVIPAAFNGDLVATMEAVYLAGGSPGPHSWTPFKQYQSTYRPNYSNNTITLTPEFLAETTLQSIDLRFHFWSGRVVEYRLNFEENGSVITRIIYDNSLASGWENWSWGGTLNFASTATAVSAPNAISVDAGGWAAVFLAYNGPDVDTSADRTLVFWANGGAEGGQSLSVGARVNKQVAGTGVLTAPLTANTWTKIEIPLSSLGVEGQSDIDAFTFQNASGTAVPTFHLDDVAMTAPSPTTVVYVDGLPLDPVGPSEVFLEIQNPSLTPDGHMQFFVTGTPGLPYAVDATLDFIEWEEVATGTVTIPAGSYADPVISPEGRRFYRARQTGDAP